MVTGRRVTYRLTQSERDAVRQQVRAGATYGELATAFRCATKTVQRVMDQCGGLGVRRTPRARLRLTVAEREEISRGLQAKESCHTIATRLGRAPSTISREVAAGGGRRRYRAWQADARADRTARRPKAAKLRTSGRLRAVVEQGLRQRWSPQQIARRLRTDFPDDPEMRVSHETIYQSLFVQGRGALRKELAQCLRTGRAQRRALGRLPRTSRLRDMVLISARPAEVADRAVPGHWEGDLVVGKGCRSAVATLVERQTRFLLLLALPDGRHAEAVKVALAAKIQELPVHLRRSLTWDQGTEMAAHAQFTIETGVQVYFCDPRSPWQRGTNENTNGLLRQYLPKGLDLTPITQAQLDEIAIELNGRPRQTLAWRTPSEALAALVR